MREIIEVNGQKFSILYLENNNLYLVSKRDGEEFRVPYTRGEFKTRNGALKRIKERAGDGNKTELDLMKKILKRNIKEFVNYAM